ncbi:hypothetical protein HRG_002310 [Hirsutella rhossiliensis]|uniref:Uncharacterized protein n=1 Tax=Hirsutella rhossiliensis TaxID=111463 RepID=A0A9P8SLF4_9HYPO|nr:uncharacterized protein HRG_02310 [Hirsutella rhossiliensis]KAH0966901.1 hypothetical protein HRG_02310 [Hirsutella rhossiliensis]
MNPLATEFTPLTSPKTRMSQLATQSSQQQAEETRHLAPSSVYRFKQESIGSASTGQLFRPHLAHPYHLAIAQDGNALFPDGVGGQGAPNDPWNQHYPLIKHPDWQEAAHRFPEAPFNLTNQSFGIEVPDDAPSLMAESNGRNTRPVPSQVGLNLRPALGVGEADSGSSYTTESLAQSHSTVTQWTPAVHQYYPGMEHLGLFEHHDQFFPDNQEADSSTVRMGVATSALRRGYTLAEQVEARSPQPPPRPAYGQDLAASGPQQMPYPGTLVPPQPGPDTYDIPSAQHVPSSLDLTDEDWPPLQPSIARAGSDLQSWSQRDRSTCRLSRSGRTRRQRLQQDVNLFQLGDNRNEVIPSQNRLDPGSELQSSHEHPLQQVQPRNDPRPALQSSAPISTALASAPPMENSAPGMSPHSPMQVSSVASVDRDRAALADTSVPLHGKPMAQKGVDDHQNPFPPTKQNQQDTFRRHLRNFETLAPNHSRERTDDELQSRGTLYPRDVELGFVQKAVIPRHHIASPGPPDAPQPHDASSANDHKLGDVSSQDFDARVISAETAACREVARASEAEAQSSRTRAAFEPGSWTSSKRWVSEEMKERQAFSKMMNNLRHIGAERSPCIPQSMTELAAFKAETAEENRKQLTRIVRRRIAELEIRKDLLQMGSKWTGTGIDKLLWGRRFQDGASPVFASDNCFSEDLAGESDARVDWPSLTELKEEGERRAGRYRRCLPLPRLNAIDPRLLAAGNADVFHPDGTIRWQAKAVSPNRAFVMPVSPPDMSTAGEDNDAKTLPAEDTESKPRSRELPEDSQTTVRSFVRRFWNEQSSSAKRMSTEQGNQ